MTTHTDLITRLRLYKPIDNTSTLINEAADAIESLEQQVAALNEELQKRDKCSYMGPMRDCPTHGIGPELAAAQAREAKLLEALELAMPAIGYGYDAARCTAAFETVHTAQAAAVQALALPTDDSALQARLKEAQVKVLRNSANRLDDLFASESNRPMRFDSMLDAVMEIRRMADELEKADAIRGLA